MATGRRRRAELPGSLGHQRVIGRRLVSEARASAEPAASVADGRPADGLPDGARLTRADSQVAVSLMTAMAPHHAVHQASSGFRHEVGGVRSLSARPTRQPPHSIQRPAARTRGALRWTNGSNDPRPAGGNVGREPPLPVPQDPHRYACATRAVRSKIERLGSRVPIGLSTARVPANELIGRRPRAQTPPGRCADVLEGHVRASPRGWSRNWACRVGP